MVTWTSLCCRPGPQLLSAGPSLLLSPPAPSRLWCGRGRPGVSHSCAFHLLCGATWWAGAASETGHGPAHGPAAVSQLPPVCGAQHLPGLGPMQQGVASFPCGSRLLAGLPCGLLSAPRLLPQVATAGTGLPGVSAALLGAGPGGCHVCSVHGASRAFAALTVNADPPCLLQDVAASPAVSRSLAREDGPTMFYGTHFIMSPPAKSKLKRQGQLLSSVLSRTLSYKYRDLDATFADLGASDDPAELSTQLSAPGVLKVFGDSVCTGAHYKSVLATCRSSAQELVREALERYSLSPDGAGQYVLCDVVGQAGDSERPWQAECVRVFGDNEKPLLIQELWKPREGLSRRFELRRRADVEELAAKDIDTVTAGEQLRAETRRGAGQGRWRPRAADHSSSAVSVAVSVSGLVGRPSWVRRVVPSGCPVIAADTVSRATGVVTVSPVPEA